MSFRKTPSVSKWLCFGRCVYVISALVLLFASTGFSSQAIKTNVSTASGIWKNITLVYPQQMNVSSDNPLLPQGCVVIKRPEQKQIAVQCQAQVKLTRPSSLVAQWQQQQTSDGYFIFNEPELGAVNVHAQITEVSPGINPASITPVNPKARPVTGIFIKYASDVRQYTFRDEVTGHLSTINATPNHPFYVTNAHKYKAVGDLSYTDHLINLSGHLISLVCPAGKNRHCGRPWHAGRIGPVYNLEVYQQHRYFAGEAQILVHNVYKCSVPWCKYTTSNVDVLHRHQRTHVTFICDKCKLDFPSEGQLRYHMRTHSAQKKMACPECKEEFPHYKILKGHFDVVHADKAVDCPLCGERYSSYVATISHVRARHGVNTLMEAKKLKAEEKRNLEEHSYIHRLFRALHLSRPGASMGASTSAAMPDSTQPPL